MDRSSFPVSGSHPSPGQKASPAPSGAISVVVVPHATPDRRRSPVQSSPSLSAAAGLRDADEHILIELRRKVQAGELLSASTERLLWKMRFNGHLTVVIQNGRVFKSGYEEGYFRRGNDLGGFLLDV